MDSVSVNGAYVYFTIPIFGGIDITQTTISLLVVSLILGFASWYFGKDIKKRPGKMQVLIEKGVSMLQNLVCETMGAHNIGWVPYIGTVFLSSLLGSLIGMTGFLRSTTADLSVPLTWGIMTSVIIWYHSIKNNGFLNWLKGFTEPIVVMTPMNIISEIAQPISMAFRHFGNVAGGGVITSILYTALGMLSTMIVGVLSKTIIIPLIVVAAAAALFVYGRRNQKKAAWITAIVFGVLGLFGVLQYTGILKDVPLLQFGIPAVLSVYFDVFSGFIQAFVFSLLSMVYISGACPPPAEKADNSIKS